MRCVLFVLCLSVLACGSLVRHPGYHEEHHGEACGEGEHTGEHKEDQEAVSSSVILILFCIATGRAFFVLKERFSCVERRLKILSTPTVYALTGWCAGAVMKISGHYTACGAFTFQEKVFQTFILPPILFNAGFNMKMGYIKYNWRVAWVYSILSILTVKIIMLALVWAAWKHLCTPELCHNTDSVLVAAVVACLMAMEPGPLLEAIKERVHIQEAHEPPPLIPLMLCMSICSMVDSVTTFAEVKKSFEKKEASGINTSPPSPHIPSIPAPSGHHHELLSLNWMQNMFGEHKHFTEEEFSELAKIMFLNVLYAFVVGVIAGLFFGTLSALYFRLYNWSKHHHPEETVAAELVGLFFFGFGTYYFCTYLTVHWGFEVPGPLAVFVCGIVMGNVTWYNVGTLSRASFPHLVKSTGIIAEVYTYGVMGSAFWNLGSGELKEKKTWAAAFALLGMLWLSRLVVSIAFVIVANFRVRQSGHWDNSFKFPDFIALVWGSTLLGHVTYGLAASTHEALGADIEPVMWIVVMFTVVFQGSLSEYIVELGRIKPRKSQDPDATVFDVKFPRLVAKVGSAIENFITAPDVRHFKRLSYTQFTRYVLCALDNAFHYLHHKDRPNKCPNPYQVIIQAQEINDDPHSGHHHPHSAADHHQHHRLHQGVVSVTVDATDEDDLPLLAPSTSQPSISYGGASVKVQAGDEGI
eukprot:TRINITY_DN51672_c0_g2_i1.p1 TRINITY_DN51672_c0_g2~~TRINITY_DN51672_c0_g2_i1.p1  ORF type:complete len:696 (-),score=47.05 TRINITY_DN51672_c0_g2_i1:795-2882(-)